MLQLIINRKRKSEHILSQQKVRKSLTFAQNEEEYKNDSDNEYESQPIISVKVALENVDNLMRFVNNPPSGLRLLKSNISRYQTDGLSQSQIDSFINVGTS